MNELTTTEPSIAVMLQTALSHGITSDNADALGKMLDVYERMEKRKAEQEFAAAFVRLQQELPTIQGSRGVPDKHGKIKFKYANFDDIDAIVRPICLKHGFTYAFRETGIDNGRVTVTMTLQHSGGHFRDVPYSVRFGSGPPGSSEPQTDVGGHSYAQRGALESGLSLRIVGEKSTVKEEGGYITQNDADNLRELCDETNSDRKKFLAFAGADSFETIAAARHDDLLSMLHKKRLAK